MADEHSIYKYTVKGVNDEPISLDKYKGKVVLIVNVASQCGLTNANYTQLKDILDKYKDKGFEVAAFPCNQFASQEPGCPIDAQEGVKNKFNFEPDFYGKVDVNGAKQDPLYAFLKKEKGGTLIDAIKWNFTKFLVDRKGHVVQRYGPKTEPNTFIKDIEKLLDEPAQ